MNRDILHDVLLGAQQVLDKTNAYGPVAKDGVAQVLARASDLYRIARGIGLDEALRTIGLQRRHGPMAGLSMFGAGMVCGAALGVVFAPATGADTRRMVRERLESLMGKRAKANGSETHVNGDSHQNGKRATRTTRMHDDAGDDRSRS